ncbi:hypothetical protein Tco_1535349, partial [Tanacetum coccineum]
YEVGGSSKGIQNDKDAEDMSDRIMRSENYVESDDKMDD